MPLLDVPLTLDADRPPADVRRFLREGERRIRRFQHARHLPAFVGSDFVAVYGALRALEESGELGGRWFCEWGSGLGVVACLAAMLGFDAWGIEAERDLVKAARRLAWDFDVAVEFVRGSYFPSGAEAGLTSGREFAWLSRAGRSAYDAMDVKLDEFDLVYAYPWPDEAEMIAELFESHARTGARLLTYHPDGELRLRQLVE
jgi:hypothetical protein